MAQSDRNCNICGSTHHSLLLDLGAHPVADSFYISHKDAVSADKYPLMLSYCHDCEHVFTARYISPDKRYRELDYSYTSDNSSISSGHFSSLAGYVKSYVADDFFSNALVLEFGSNVGTLLKAFSDIGAGLILGMDPSRNMAEIANQRDINTICEYFSKEAIRKNNLEGKAGILISTNAVNHIDDLNGMMEGVSLSLSETGFFVFEVPYVVDLVETVGFEAIYHEHVNYFSVKSIATLLNSHGFNICDVHFSEYMCGTLRIIAVRESAVNCSDYESEAINREQQRMPDLKASFQRVDSLIRGCKNETRELVHSIKHNGKKIIGIGAATKGNTFLNYFGLDESLISCITDTSSHKIGKYAPGSGIPILSEPDGIRGAEYGIVLPWNISKYITSLPLYKNIELIDYRKYYDLH